MLEFNNILCPIDFSEISVGALRYAATLSRWYDAHLEVLHAVPGMEEEVSPAHYERVWPSRGQLTRDIERAIAEVGATDLKTSVLAQVGRAHEIIERRARELPADLLVMGTHGRSGFNRLLLGSVTEKVLRLVGCPVLTVPPKRAEGKTSVTFRTIVCAMDYSPSALKALQYALNLGRQAGGCVTVLYALEYADPEEILEPSPFDRSHQALADSRRRREALIGEAHRHLQDLIAREPTTWCEITETVVVGRAYKAILRHAQEVQADLIVMGAQGTAGLELMLYGSNTQHVLRAATCPVLSVRAEGAGAAASEAP